MFFAKICHKFLAFLSFFAEKTLKMTFSKYATAVPFKVIKMKRHLDGQTNKPLERNTV